MRNSRRKERGTLAANHGGVKAIALWRVCACLAAALALGIAACSEQERTFSPTPQLQKQLGLPLYPNAVPVRKGAHEMTMSSRFGETISLIVQYETNDDFDKVRAFYNERLPSTKRVISIPMGQVHTVTMQFTDKTGQKQVTLVAIRGVTMIQLQSTTLNFASPSAEPSANPAPSTAPAPSG